jgi:hypothetical protein
MCSTRTGQRRCAQLVRGEWQAAQGRASPLLLVRGRVAAGSNAGCVAHVAAASSSRQLGGLHPRGCQHGEETMPHMCSANLAAVFGGARSARVGIMRVGTWCAHSSRAVRRRCRKERGRAVARHTTRGQLCWVSHAPAVLSLTVPWLIPRTVCTSPRGAAARTYGCSCML